MRLNTSPDNSLTHIHIEQISPHPEMKSRLFQDFLIQVCDQFKIEIDKVEFLPLFVPSL